MSKKIEKIFNYIVITDSVTGETNEFPASRLRYKDYGDTFQFIDIDDKNQNKTYQFNDLTDGDGLAWSDVSILISWLRQNTVFKLASVSGAQGTLEHFKYNPVTDRLEADRSIQTILNSFELGDVHTVSSGGENVFFTNNSSDIDWFPMWGGIKDQSILSNRDKTGLVQPSARQYGSSVIEILQGVSAETSGFVYYESTDIISDSSSLFGLDTVLAETVSNSDFLHYEVYRGSDDSGAKAYEQSLTGVSIPLDGGTDWFFSHPFEAHEGTQLYFRLTKSTTKDGDRELVKVRPSTISPSDYYVKAYIRTFEDLDLEFISPYLNYEGMNFSLDDSNTNVIFSNHDTGEALKPFFINELKAIDNGNGGIQIYIKEGTKIYIDDIDVSKTYIDSALVTQSISSAVNELNSLFSNTGTAGGSTPTVTSSLTINIVEGETFNYNVTGDFGSEIIWDFSSVYSVSASNGNNWNISGGDLLTSGAHNVEGIMRNQNGSTPFTIVVNVANPPYSNTKAIRFNNNDFAQATATTVNPLYRPSNGSGSLDASSFGVWFKGGSNGSAKQTVICFGGNDEDNEGSYWLKWDASGGNKRIVLRYGSKNNFITLKTPVNSFTKDTYKHILVTYDGGTTGASSGSVNDYYGRFKIFIDGIEQTLTASHNNYGWSGEIKAEVFKIGEASFGGDHLRNGCVIDELALWGSDESLNIASIYNSGTTHDLGLLPSAPVNYWRFGDGDTFPYLSDNIGSLTFEQFNQTTSDTVNDVP